jgi:hypothetical protein
LVPFEGTMFKTDFNIQQARNKLLEIEPNNIKNKEKASLEAYIYADVVRNGASPDHHDVVLYIQYSSRRRVEIPWFHSNSSLPGRERVMSMQRAALEIDFWRACPVAASRLTMVTPTTARGRQRPTRGLEHRAVSHTAAAVDPVSVRP